jgi:hypothetical protein
MKPEIQSIQSRLVVAMDVVASAILESDLIGEDFDGIGHLVDLVYFEIKGLEMEMGMEEYTNEIPDQESDD